MKHTSTIELPDIEAKPRNAYSATPYLLEKPPHWKAEKGKWLFEKIERPIRKDDDIITCFRDGQVTLRINRKTEGFTNALKEHGYQGIRKGDLVIHNMDAFAGAIGVSDADGKATPVYSVCVPRAPSQVNPYYYAYFLRNLSKSGYIQSLAKGIRERSTDFRYADFAELLLPVPPLREQTRIAEFLDRKTAQIDKAIAQKEKLIELLKERRQILIHNAVTRGLNPNVKMKDSGVEWIGEVPEHWRIGRVKQFATTISKGTTPSTEGRPLLDQGPVRFIKAENIQEGFITNNPAHFIDERTNHLIKRSSLQNNDILFVIAGATLGKVAIVKDEVLPANTNQAVAFVRPNDRILSEYLALCLTASYVKELTWLEAVQSAQPNLSMEALGNLPLFLPDKAEQAFILTNVKELENKIERQILMQNKLIELLKEYKATLINSAVTGKMKIRD